MKTTTKTELAARVAELEAEVKDLQIERDALGREVEAEWFTRGNLQAQVAQLKAMLAAQAQPTDTFQAFLASIPAKTLYRILARALHPDVGGDTATMQALNAAWARRAN